MELASVGEIEKKTQARVVALFRERLGYDYLGHWIDRPGNRNIEPELLRAWLARQGVSEMLINRALHELNKAATDTGKHLYDRNKEVYDLLRYGVKVQPGAGENKVTVWPIDWKYPENNHFAIAEEVTVKGADAKASRRKLTPSRWMRLRAPFIPGLPPAFPNRLDNGNRCWEGRVPALQWCGSKQ